MSQAGLHHSPPLYLTTTLGGSLGEVCMTSPRLSAHFPDRGNSNLCPTNPNLTLQLLHHTGSYFITDNSQVAVLGNLLCRFYFVSHIVSKEILLVKSELQLQTRIRTGSLRNSQKHSTTTAHWLIISNTDSLVSALIPSPVPNHPSTLSNPSLHESPEMSFFLTRATILGQPNSMPDAK